ncbi:unnamed protein product, partial [Aphanomyces euteiches]
SLLSGGGDSSSPGDKTKPGGTADDRADGAPAKATDHMKEALSKMYGLTAIVTRVTRDLRQVERAAEKMEPGHARVSQDKAAQLEDANDKLTRQNASQADTLSKMQAEGAKQAARIKALEDELAITKKLAVRSEKAGRIRSERDDLRREVVRLRNERVGFGHRYLNWGIRKNLVSDTRNADLSVRAWLHEEGILDDPGSVSQWQATTGYTLIPNEADPTSIPFTLPCGSESKPPRSD